MHNKKTIIIVALAIIAILLLFWYLKPSNDAVAPQTDKTAILDEQGLPIDPNIPPATNSLPPTKNSILVSTQVAGDSVTIDNIFLDTPGFVVIHEADQDQPGKIIGKSGLLNPGNGQDLEIRANLQQDKTYFAMLHKDDGNKIFDEKLDTPLLNEKSLPIMVMFKTSN